MAVVRVTAVVMVAVVVIVMVVAHGRHYFTTQAPGAIANRNRPSDLQDFDLAAAVIRSK